MKGQPIDRNWVGTIQLHDQLIVLTVFTIFLVPVVRDWAGWGPAFPMLAPGPAVGAWAMSRLESGSRESDRHPHRADLGPGPVGEAV